MKIFSAAQIKAWDAYTMEYEPVASADLMERAARGCADWIMSHTESGRHICIFCGPGNNGGDGLAIARLLAAQQRKVSVYLAGTDAHRSPDNALNLLRLQQLKQEIKEIAEIAVLLASNEAGFMTGSNIVIDGGMSL